MHETGFGTLQVVILTNISLSFVCVSKWYDWAWWQSKRHWGAWWSCQQILTSWLQIFFKAKCQSCGHPTHTQPWNPSAAISKTCLIALKCCKTGLMLDLHHASGLVAFILLMPSWQVPFLSSILFSFFSRSHDLYATVRNFFWWRGNLLFSVNTKEAVQLFEWNRCAVKLCT